MDRRPVSKPIAELKLGKGRRMPGILVGDFRLSAWDLLKKALILRNELGWATVQPAS